MYPAISDSPNSSKFIQIRSDSVSEAKEWNWYESILSFQAMWQQKAIACSVVMRRATCVTSSYVTLSRSVALKFSLLSWIVEENGVSRLRILEKSAQDLSFVKL